MASPFDDRYQAAVADAQSQVQEMLEPEGVKRRAVNWSADTQAPTDVRSNADRDVSAAMLNAESYAPNLRGFVGQVTGGDRDEYMGQYERARALQEESAQNQSTDEGFGAFVRRTAIGSAPDLIAGLGAGGIGRGLARKTVGSIERNAAVRQVTARMAETGADGVLAKRVAAVNPGAAAATPVVAAKQRQEAIGDVAQQVINRTAAGKRIDRAGRVGGFAGATAGTFPGMLAGSNEELMATDQEGAAAIGTFDAAASAIGAIPVDRVLGRIYNNPAAKQAINENLRTAIPRILKEMGKQAGAEGTTEAIQAYVQRAGHKWVNDNVEMLSPEALQDYLANFVGGAVLGGGLGGAVEVANVAPGAIGGSVRWTADQTKAGYQKIRETLASAGDKARAKWDARQGSEPIEPTPVGRSGRGNKGDVESTAADLFQQGRTAVAGMATAAGDTFKRFRDTLGRNAKEEELDMRAQAVVDHLTTPPSENESEPMGPNHPSKRATSLTQKLALSYIKPEFLATMSDNDALRLARIAEKYATGIELSPVEVRTLGRVVDHPDSGLTQASLDFLSVADGPSRELFKTMSSTARPQDLPRQAAPRAPEEEGKLAEELGGDATRNADPDAIASDADAALADEYANAGDLTGLDTKDFNSGVTATDAVKDTPYHRLNSLDISIRQASERLDALERGNRLTNDGLEAPVGPDAAQQAANELRAERDALQKEADETYGALRDGLEKTQTILTRNSKTDKAKEWFESRRGDPDTVTMKEEKQYNTFSQPQMADLGTLILKQTAAIREEGTADANISAETALLRGLGEIQDLGYTPNPDTFNSGQIKTKAGEILATLYDSAKGEARPQVDNAVDIQAMREAVKRRNPKFKEIRAARRQVAGRLKKPVETAPSMRKASAALTARINAAKVADARMRALYVAADEAKAAHAKKKTPVTAKAMNDAKREAKKFYADNKKIIELGKQLRESGGKGIGNAYNADLNRDAQTVAQGESEIDGGESSDATRLTPRVAPSGISSGDKRNTLVPTEQGIGKYDANDSFAESVREANAKMGVGQGIEMDVKGKRPVATPVSPERQRAIRVNYGRQFGERILSKQLADGKIEKFRFDADMKRLQNDDVAAKYFDRAERGEFASASVRDNKALDDTPTKLSDDKVLAQAKTRLDRAVNRVLMLREDTDTKTPRKLTDKVYDSDIAKVIDSLGNLSGKYGGTSVDGDKETGTRTPKRTPEDAVIFNAEIVADGLKADHPIVVALEARMEAIQARVPNKAQTTSGVPAGPAREAAEARAEALRKKNDKAQTKRDKKSAFVNTGKGDNPLVRKDVDSVAPTADADAIAKEQAKKQAAPEPGAPVEYENDVAAIAEAGPNHDLKKESGLVNALLKALGYTDTQYTVDNKTNTGSAGTVRYTEGKVSLNDRLTGRARVEVLSHEIGHAVIAAEISRVTGIPVAKLRDKNGDFLQGEGWMKELKRVNPELFAAFKADYDVWAAQHGRLDSNYVAARMARNPAGRAADIRRRARKHGRTEDTIADASNNPFYEVSMNEWMADNIARAMLTNSTGQGVVDSFFAKIGKQLRRVYDLLFKGKTGKQFAPAPSVEKWIASLFDANKAAVKTVTGQSTTQKKANAAVSAAVRTNTPGGGRTIGARRAEIAEGIDEPAQPVAVRTPPRPEVSAIDAAMGKTSSAPAVEPSTLADMLNMSEDEYIKSINEEGTSTDPGFVAGLDKPREISVPEDATLVATENGIQVFKTKTNLYAVVDGKPVGFVNFGLSKVTLSYVAPSARGKGVGNLLTKELLRTKPFAKSGGLTPAAEKARRNAYRALKAETTAADPTPTKPARKPTKKPTKGAPPKPKLPKTVRGMMAYINNFVPPAERQILERAFSTPGAVANLRKFYKNDPEALLLLDSAKEGLEGRIALGYLAWSKDKLKSEVGGPQTKKVFYSIWDNLLALFNLAGDGVYAQRILTDIRNGNIQRFKALNKTYSVAQLEARSRGDLQKWVDQVGNIKDKITRPLDRFLDSKMSQMANSGVPAMRKLAFMLHRPGGVVGERGYNNSVVHTTSAFAQGAARAFEGLDKGQQRRVMDLLQRQVTDPAVLAKYSKPVQDAVKDVRELMDTAFAYMEKSGVKVGRRRNFFPVQLDLRNERSKDRLTTLLMQPKFEKAIREFFSNGEPDHVNKDGKKLSKIEDMVANLVDNASGEAGPSVTGAGAPNFKAMNFRSMEFVHRLGNAADIKEFANLQTKNPAESFARYIEPMVRRAEYSRRFGDDGKKLDAILADMAKQGATPEQIQQAKDAVEAAIGTWGAKGSPILAKLSPSLAEKFSGPKTKATMQGLQAYNNARLLWLSTLSSLVDPMGIAVRTGGDFSTSWAGMKKGMKSIVNGKTRAELQDMLALLGATSEMSTMEALNQGFGGSANATAAKVNDFVFKWNGLAGWTRATRYMALVSAHQFLLKHSERKGDTSDRYLAELGVKRGDVQMVIRDLPHGGVETSVKLLTPAQYAKATQHSKDADDRVKQALMQFVDEAILRPNSQQTPQWHSDPFMSLVSQYKAFSYAIFDQIGGRVSREMQHGNGKVLLAAASYVPIVIMAEMLRDVVQGDSEDKDEWGPEDYLLQGVDRSGLAGPRIGVYGDIKGDIEHRRTPGSSLIGPTGQQARNLGGALQGERDLGKEFESALPGSGVFRKWNDEPQVAAVQG